jgi:N-formylglutamate amidohydrolase
MYTAYGIFTLYEWSWRSYSSQVERELSALQNSLSTSVLQDHHDHSKRVTIPYAVYIQFDHLMTSIILLETLYE